MRNRFKTIIEQDREWFVGWSPGILDANEQQGIVEERRTSLGAPIRVILDVKRKD
jgi:hypothetical protein